MRKVPKMKLVDRLHRTFVQVCIAVTIFGAANLMYVGYNYYAYIKPLRKAEYERKQKELLQEGIGLTESN